MQSNGNTIFVGIRVSERLRDQLDSSQASMKSFFNEKNPEFLQFMHIDSDEYIGKVTASGTSLEVLGNMLQNVKTMLGMICPKFTVADGAIKIHALAPTTPRTAGAAHYYGTASL